MAISTAMGDGSGKSELIIKIASDGSGVLGPKRDPKVHLLLFVAVHAKVTPVGRYAWSKVQLVLGLPKGSRQSCGCGG